MFILTLSVLVLYVLVQKADAASSSLRAALLSDAPSIKLHVSFKRKSMELHGHSEFNIYATPVVSANGASLLYNSYATFHDDDSEFTYSLVDGSAYLTTTDADDVETVVCLPSNTLPFDEMLSALNDATPIASASIGDKSVECESGTLFKTTFAGSHYAICASGEAGLTAYSSDLNIELEYLDDPVSISKPELTERSSSCEIVQEATSLTPTALALATGRKIPFNTSRKLKAEAHMAMEATQCKTCPTVPRPCIFLHGLGNPNDVKELQDTPKLTRRKFGDMHGHAPCCSKIKYAVMNTKDAGWRNDTLQRKYCDYALSMSDTSDVSTGTIDKTIIVTHSMGGLVLAHALATGKCRFSETTSWVSLSPPMTGSMAVDYLMGTCHNGTSDITEKLYDLVGQCPLNTARKSTIYQGGEFSSPSIDAAYVAAQKAYRKNVAAAMCSDSYVGLFSAYQAKCILAGAVIPHKSKKNDALVEFNSCLGGLDEKLFGDHYLDTFYRPKLNHADTAFLNGDGILKNSQKPRKWFECLQL